MGREFSKHENTLISLKLMTCIDDRLEQWAKEYGWTKTKVIEYALTEWLNRRDMEARANELAKTR